MNECKRLCKSIDLWHRTSDYYKKHNPPPDVRYQLPVYESLEMPPQILIPGAYPFQNGLPRGSIPSREPAPHDPKIYGGLGGMIATSSALGTSTAPHQNGTTDATSLGDQRASVPRHLVNFSPQPGMIHPSMVSLLSQGYNLAHLGVPAPFFPFNPRQQQPQSMPRAATSSAAAVNHHGVIKQSQPIQHLKTKNMTPHNK